MAAGTGGTATVDTTGEYIFQPTGNRETGCTSLQVWVASGGNNAKITVTGMHDSGVPAWIPAGGTAVFRSTEMGIREAFAEADTGTTVIFWGVVAKTGGI